MTDDAAEATDSHEDETADSADAEAAVDRESPEVESAEDATETDADGAETEPTAGGLTARVAEHDEALAREVGALESRVDDLEAALDERSEEVEETRSRLKRTRADFQNYKKRTKKRQEQLRETATQDFVERVVTVRDNLVRALDQDEDADIRGGVDSTLDEFDRILADEGVSTIEPEAGEEVDPHRHEVMLRVDADQPEGTVVDVYQPGYEMGERVIRAAQVTVSSGGDGE